jgi:hypothetical protein
MEAHHETNRRKTVVKRAIVVAISVLLALVVAAPIASGQSSSKKHNLAQLTAEQANWAFATNPSPLSGGEPNYSDAQCNGEYVNGVIFLAGAIDGSATVERNCTVPRNKPILFSPFNYLCSEAPTVQKPDGTFTGDPMPYTQCAKDIMDGVIASDSSFYAKVDGKDANQQRIASGLFQWTVPVDNPLASPPPAGVSLPAGTYPAAQDGFWVYLEHGLKKGNHIVQFGGSFINSPIGTFEGTKVTYNLKAE